MRYSHHDEQVFQHQVEEAMKTVERILEVHRNPRLAQDVEHGYEDKYQLADILTNTAIIAQMNVLERLGLTADVLKSIDKSKATTLRFQASDTCVFLKEQNVEVPMERSHQTTSETQTTGAFFGNTKKSTISKVVNHVKEFHWKVDFKWEIAIYAGTNVAQNKIVQTRSSSMIVVTQSNKQPPLPKHREHTPLDVSLTWLMKQIDNEKLTAQFKIDTQDPDTKTPRRNKQVDETLMVMSNLQRWTRDLRVRLTQLLQRDIIDKHNPAKPEPHTGQSSPLGSLSASTLFLPIQPLMEEESAGDDSEKTQKVESADPKSLLSLTAAEGDDEDPSPLLSSNDLNKLLNEQIRSIQEKCESLQKTYPARQLVKLVSVAEAVLVVLSEHSEHLSIRYAECMEYLEKMLENQLIAAIGKKVESRDLDQFVKFHNAKLLDPAPQPFCHSIRRPNHYPDGLLSIESAGGDGKMEAIDTLVRELDDPSPLKVPLNAATSLELTGKQFLHGWVQHRFQSHHKAYKLIARARQFSSFMLVVGTMVGSNELEPKEAIILQNKDEILIPLLLNELPTAKEFKDAIRSLSPEQQRFAKAFRSMQLESSIFGVCVIQIKPQLEELLGLPQDALTKEMQLSQDLMELFVEYQVPSDLLSYDGDDPDTSVKDKVSNVKGHVQAVMDVIGDSKTKQLEDQAMRADMAVESLPLGGTGGNTEVELERMGDPFANAMKSRGSRRSLKYMSSHVRAPMALQALQMTAPAAATNVSAQHAFKSTLPGDMFGSAPRPKVDSTATQGSRPSPQKSEYLAPKADGTVAPGENVVDLTLMPKILDSTIEKHDADSALRSTIIKTSDAWTRKRQANLLTKIESSTLHSEDIKSEKDKAFDLLDALSRSGTLPISCSELHVIMSVTHCFEKDVMGTVIQDNINPIEKLEMSTLLVASTIHGVPANMLVRDANELQRLTASFPALLSASENESRIEEAL